MKEVRGQGKTGYNRIRHALWDQDQRDCVEYERRVNGITKGKVYTGNASDEITS